MVFGLFVHRVLLSKQCNFVYSFIVCCCLSSVSRGSRMVFGLFVHRVLLSKQCNLVYSFIV
jgi:hypothetical protein